MKLIIEDSPKSVTVVTPTICSEKLMDCLESVEKQTYKNVKHLIVVDGREHSKYLGHRIGLPPKDHVKFIVLPENTGKTGGEFYGHRIYAGIPHLLNSDYILFLDEDNWYEPNHVETLVQTAESKNLDFSFSLRKIFSPEGKYITDDNCESLGKWPIFMSRRSPHGEQFLIDTSSFCFKREFIQKTCHYWHAGWGGDRQYLYAVKQHAKYDTNGKHTLCYRLDGNP
ncbi:glycosyltransferase family 2 protein, partial [bacterium]|nr:glycosyltransferase family 2 protein [bacterium]